MKSKHVRTLTRVAAVSMALTAAGCSSLDGLKDASVDYRNGARKTAPLDVPPDLTPLARDGRYAPQGMAVSAVELQQQQQQRGSRGAPTASATVAPNQAGDLRIERLGQQRWLVTSRSPEAVWPQVRQFWLDQGFSLITDNAQSGVLETDWQENRAKLPKDIVRQTVGKVLDRLFDTSERDRYRVRLERTATGTEVYVAHHGLALEVDRNDRSTAPFWVARPNDPTLEAEMLSLMLVRLGAPAESAPQVVASAGDRAATAGPQARLLTDASAGAGLTVDDALERAWRRVGLALDRGGFTVEERDRSQGLYQVRYVDPKLAGQEPGFFAKLFSSDKGDKSLARYRVALKADGTRTQVLIQDSQGNPERSENGKRIASVLVEELR